MIENNDDREGYTPLEKEYILLCIENRELQDMNFRLCDKKDELEKKLKLLNYKCEDDDMFKIKEKAYEQESEFQKLQDKIEKLEAELNFNNGKIEILENVLKGNQKIEDIFKSASNEIIRYFNDMAIKNIEKMEELNATNKILMEKLVMLGKEYKKLCNAK